MALTHEINHALSLHIADQLRIWPLHAKPTMHLALTREILWPLHVKFKCVMALTRQIQARNGPYTPNQVRTLHAKSMTHLALTRETKYVALTHEIAFGPTRAAFHLRLVFT